MSKTLSAFVNRVRAKYNDFVLVEKQRKNSILF